MIVAGVQHGAHAQDQHQHDGGADGGQGDVPQAAQTARAVHHGGFVQLGVHVGQGGQEDDGAPAGFLPDGLADNHPAEGVRRAHVVDGMAQHDFRELVHDAGRPEHDEGDGNDDDDGDEVRHVEQRLQQLFIAQRPHFVEQQRQDDRSRKIKDDVHQAQDQRIGQIGNPGRKFEEVLEPLKAHPLAAQDAGVRHVVFKRDDDAEHGQVLKDHKVDQPREQEQIQPLVPLDFRPEPAPVFLAGAVQRPPFRSLGAHKRSTFLFKFSSD